ncbi:MAG: S41 family peptidase, partial [Pseudomonadota bacterium]
KGGITKESVGLVDVFLEEGKKVVVTSMRPETAHERKYQMTSRPAATQKSLVVLIDENSASASEIFSGAIKAHKRGLLVGLRTYGKGSEQKNSSNHPILRDIPLWTYFFPELYFYKTLGYYFLANGYSPQWDGIEPDIQSFDNPAKTHEEGIIREREAFPLSLRDINQGLPAFVGINVQFVSSCLEKSSWAENQWNDVKNRPFHENFQYWQGLDSLSCLIQQRSQLEDFQ